MSKLALPNPAATMRDRLALALVATLALGPAASAQFVTYEDSSSLGIDDLAITPDGRFLVSRDGGAGTETSVVDLTTGTRVYTHMAVAPMGRRVGPCVDAVAASNERAVSIGATAVVIDLTQSPPVLLAEHDLGETPRDVEITPDGRFALVRGGILPAGGIFVLELATGAVVFSAAEEAQNYLSTGNDLCAVTDDHGVALAYDPVQDRTHVHVMEFGAAGGPGRVFRTIGPQGLSGLPMDVDISEDGLWAGVRSSGELALLRLDGTATALSRRTGTFSRPIAPFGTYTYDSVWMVGDMAVTVSLRDPIPAGGILDAIDSAGSTWSADLPGVPHDAALFLDGSRLAVNTEFGLGVYDIAGRPPGGGTFPELASESHTSAQYGLLAGLDSVEGQGRWIQTMVPTFSGGTRIRVRRLATFPSPVGLETDLDLEMVGRPIDLAVDPSGTFAAWATSEEFLVADLRTMTVRLRKSVATFGLAGWPWGDGAALHPLHAGLSGVAGINSLDGWLRTVDLVSRESIACDGGSGAFVPTGTCFALGSTRLAAADLRLEATGVAPDQFGAFFYGDAVDPNPSSGALLCVSGATDFLPVLVTGAAGTAGIDVDLGGVPAPGSGFLAGSTWAFQFVYREPSSPAGAASTSASVLLLQ